MKTCNRPSLKRHFGNSLWIVLYDQPPNGDLSFPVSSYKVLSKTPRHFVELLIAVVGFLCALAGPAIAEGQFYFNVVAPNGTVIPVGPYPNYSQASDTFGSALYSHPWACHLGLGPTKITCRNIGNGFAYPQYMPFPVPIGEPDYAMLGEAPYNENDSPDKLKRGWYFLFFTTTGGSIEKCSDLGIARKLVKTVPGDEIGYYRDLKCPGAPCFSVGFDTACN
jgi:hypothetical protein